MKVKELMEQLKNVDADCEVVFQGKYERLQWTIDEIATGYAAAVSDEYFMESELSDDELDELKKTGIKGIILTD